MLQFQGFKPAAMQRMAKSIGFEGDMQEFNKFLDDNPDKQEQMNVYSEKAKEMMMGGYVKGYANGGVVQPNIAYYRMPDGSVATDDPTRVSQVIGPKDTGTPISFSEYQQGTPVATLSSPLGQIQPTVLPRDYVPNPNAEKFGQPANPQATAPPVGPVDYTQGPVPQSTGYQGGTITEAMSNRAFTPGLPYGATVSPVGTAFNANQAVDTSSGQVSGAITGQATGATTMGAVTPTATPVSTMDASTVSNEVGIAADTLTAAQGAVDPRAVIAAQTTVNTGVSNLDAVQGTGILMDNPNQRKVETGELVSGAANAETAATFTEQVQAAEATPTNKATVQGQLEGLMAAFEGGNTPAWAAGAMRNVTTQMANRGLGASSMAAQALIQGAMESALPIAQADAQIIAQFEAQNLSNRQQRAMLAAQQRATFMGMEFDQSFQARVQNSARIGDIANLNFTAEQQVELENSKIANTVNLQNLNSKQALIMSEAAALAQLDMANLSNHQQAAVLNAQSFMQMDLQNLSNQQQTDLFKSQQRIQALFTDQAATNASRQFNASSQNQRDDFFANLKSATAQFNATQSNAQSQFNSGQTNAMDQFNKTIQNQRDQFNAQNRLVIDQNNAQWRRQIATADTVAINRANEINASSVLNMSETSFNNLWKYYADTMHWAWESAEDEQDRWNAIVRQEMANNASITAADVARDHSNSLAFGELIGTFLTGGSKFLSGPTSST